ncbi:hypothetical protein CSV78_15340 [Sporosarcina sp. P16a]|nr:hypothetical protein CSV78_15340 [Sporosarcina sp. P16a]PIC92007.1 hypothetical protein CSV70_12755 [Sporosarcina sp. P25]
MEAPVGDAFCPGSRTRADPPRVAASFRFNPTLMVEVRRSITVDSVLIIVLSGLISVQVQKFNTHYNTNFNAQQKVTSAHIARDWSVRGGDSERISVRLETLDVAKRRKRLKPRPPESVPL